MILRKETETFNSFVLKIIFITVLIRMNDTPQGDGNVSRLIKLYSGFKQVLNKNE